VGGGVLTTSTERRTTSRRGEQSFGKALTENKPERRISRDELWGPRDRSTHGTTPVRQIPHCGWLFFREEGQEPFRDGDASGEKKKRGRWVGASVGLVGTPSGNLSFRRVTKQLLKSKLQKGDQTVTSGASAAQRDGETSPMSSGETGENQKRTNQDRNRPF